MQNKRNTIQNIAAQLEHIRILKKIVNDMNEFVSHRLDSLDQPSKELLQIVYNIPQQHMPVYACVITYFLGVCLGLNQ